MKRILLLASLSLGLIGKSISQNVFDPTDPIVRYSSSAAYGSAQRPDTTLPGLQKYVSVATNGISSGTGSWDASSYKAYFIKYYNTTLAFRLKFPKSYTNPDSANKKYPMMLFMHGAGEVACTSNGGIYNNEMQLTHGGQTFMNGVDNGKFDGFLIFPELRSQDGSCWGEWGNSLSPQENTIITFIDSLIKYTRADIDRLFIDGLSGGGVAVWRLAEYFPTRVASIAPTSAAGLLMNYPAIVHIPVWLATGGKDTDPSPTMAQYSVTQDSSIGANIRWTLYPTLGHASWDAHWAEPDFFPNMNRTHKANPLIFFNRFEFCPDAPISTKIGISPGFYAYEWQKDGQTIATSVNSTNTILDNTSIISFTGNEVTVKAFGTYRVHFKRTSASDWSAWSPIPAVISPKTITQTPPITVVGLKSSVLPSLDGKNSVQLQMPAGYLNYQWYRATDNTLVSTNQIYDAPVGSYKARYSEPFGCGTLFSPVFTVAAASGTPKPDPAKNLAISSLSQKGLRLDWSDNPNAGTNETGFEIYRGTKSGGPYALVTVTAPNVVTYNDTTLVPNNKYFYVIRAVAATGAAANSNEAWGTTQIDNQPPTAPTNLQYRGSNTGTVFLQWGASTDDVGLARYDIYVNGAKMYSTTDLSFPVANLDSLTSYTFVVKAVDKAGNISPASNQVLGYTHRQGLNYKYYQGNTANNLPDFASLTPVLSGITDTVNAGDGIRLQDDNFAFLWEGYIYIPIAGYYTFETNSDDGSKMFLDAPWSYSATPFINNDGAHGATTVTATKYLTQGYHQVAYAYEELTGDQVMDIYWSSTGTGLARERIPKNFFSRDNPATGSTVISPTSLVATPVSYNMINLRWKDNSTDESGFEIVRSTSMTGTFTSVITVGANVTSYTDSGLVAGTTYYYKIRSINSTSVSPYEFSYTEGNWDFNNSYADSSGMASNTLSGTNVTFNSSDKAEGTRSASIANNGYLSFGSTAGGFLGAGGYNQRTVALWIKPTSTTNKAMIFDLGGSDNGLGIRLNSSGLIGGIASGSSRTTITLSNFASSSNWKSGQWNHVALVYDNTSLTLYLNGVSVASTNSLTFSSIAAFTNASRIGNTTGTNVFNDNSGYSTFQGLIDNMYVIRGAMSKSEIDSMRALVYMPSYAATLAAPAKPAAPSGLTAQALSVSSIQLKWNDNSNNETGFEIFRSSGDKSNNRLVATAPAGSGGQITFLDSALFANVTYYYKVRATGITSPSDSSAEATARTLNTKPVLQHIRDFTMKYGTTFVLPVNATDVDGDILSFTTAHLPVFATVASPSNGLLNITFSPNVTKIGSYIVTVYVSDGNGGKDTTSFTIVVNSNDVPVMSQVVTDTSLNEGGQWTIPLTGTDKNGTAKMTWVFDGLPPFATWVNNNNGTGVLTFKPNYTSSGTYQTTVTLNDGFGAWTSRTINLTVVDKAPDETVQFNFRNTGAPIPLWNNVNVVSPSFSHSTIYDIKGNVSSLALSLVNGTVAPTSSGWTTGNNTGVYPDVVLKDAMIWGFNVTTNANDTIQVKVSGLDPTKNYNFMFQTGYNINATTTFKIGTASVSRNGYQNTMFVDTLKNVTSNSAGEVLITMIGDVSATRGGILNAMVVSAIYDDGSTPAKPLGFAGAIVPNAGVSLIWQDRAYNEKAYYIYRASAKSGPYTLLDNGATNADSTSYTDSVVAPLTTYYYYVVGINKAGTGISSDTIKIITGNNSPKVVAAAGIYVKTGAVVTSDFTATDDPGDVVTVTLDNQPSFVTLQSLGGTSYRITVSPNNDHIGWYMLAIRATDDKGAVTIKNVPLGISDKNTRSVFINFGSPTATAPAPWNNWLGTLGSGAFITSLKDETNTVTPFVVTNSVAWSGLNDLGHITGNNSGVYPDSVMTSGLFDITGPKTFTITGLNNAKKYNVVFVGSMNEGGNNLVEYSSGTIKDTLNSKYNTNQTANVNGLTPSSGTISVTAARVTGTSYLNAMVIEEYDPTVVTILNPLNLYAEPVDRTNVDLSWSDRTQDEDLSAGYILEKASDSLFTQNVVSLNLPANTTTYRYASLTANTKYWFRVKAMNSGGAFSDYSNRVKAVTPASLVYVNFNYTMPSADAPWNNTYSTPSLEGTVFSNLTNQSGIISGLSLTLTDVFNGEFTAGLVTGNNSGVVPDAVLSSDYWQDNTQLSEFRLSGLNQTRRYRIGFFGSSGPYGWTKGNYTGTYTVNGRTVYLNSWLNTSKIVYIGDIVPNDDGTVLLDFSTTVAAQYGFHGGLIIEDYTDPNPAGGSQSNLVLSDPGLLSDVMGQNPTTNQQIAAAETATDTKMYPNPFVDFINMDFDNSSAENNISVDVYDLSGRISYHRNYGKLPTGSNTLSLNGNEAGMTTGMYIVTLNVNGKPIQANKVIRTKK